MHDHQIPMKLFGIVGLVITLFCILGYMVNEEAISVQVVSSINNGVWGATTLFSLMFTICSFLGRKGLAIISGVLVIIGMVIYFGFLDL